mmetsp:Transcript_35596/g.119000  ORF Transcript_35596/g.119000 Transcript_35596/m.119000 type:complete len:381 (-) Transcript_35596:503-1645(-)
MRGHISGAAASEVDVLARELSAVQAVVVGLACGVRLDELGRLRLDPRLEGGLEAAPRRPRLDRPPHLAELRRVGQCARVERREPRSQQQPAVALVVAVCRGGWLARRGELPRRAAVIDLVVVEEGKLARLLHKLVPDLEPDLLDKVDRLDLFWFEPPHAVDILRVLDVRGRELRGEFAVWGVGPDREGNDSLAAFPDALDGLVEGLRQRRRPLDHHVVDGDGGSDATLAADGGGPHAEERDDIAHRDGSARCHGRRWREVDFWPRRRPPRSSPRIPRDPRSPAHAAAAQECSTDAPRKEGRLGKAAPPAGEMGARSVCVRRVCAAIVPPAPYPPPLTPSTACAPVRMEAEVVVGLLAILWRLASHLGLDEPDGHAETARL